MLSYIVAMADTEYHISVEYVDCVDPKYNDPVEMCLRIEIIMVGVTELYNCEQSSFGGFYIIGITPNFKFW